MPGQLEHAGDRLEDLVGEDDPGHVHLARPDRRPSPSRGRRPARSRGRARCRSGRRPSTARRRCGREVGLQPGQAALGERRPADVGDREVVPGAGPGEVAAQRRSPVGVGVEERERRRRVGDRVQPGEHRRPCRPAAGAGPRGRRRRASCRRSCRAARRAGPRPSMRSIRKNGVPSTSPVGSIQRTAGTGTSVSSPHDPHRVVLVLERVAREDREVLGGRGDPGDVLAPALLAALGPGGVEEQRLRRHAVGVDAAVQHDDGVGAGGQHGRPATRPAGRERSRRGSNVAASGRGRGAWITWAFVTRSMTWNVF